MIKCSSFSSSRLLKVEFEIVVELHKKVFDRGAWVAQSVECLTSAQVMILQSISLSPVSGSVLTARSLEPVSDSVSPSLSLTLPIHALSPSVSKINKH